MICPMYPVVLLIHFISAVDILLAVNVSIMHHQYKSMYLFISIYLYIYKLYVCIHI
jgi:hypothetical protein